MAPRGGAHATARRFEAKEDEEMQKMLKTFKDKKKQVVWSEVVAGLEQLGCQKRTTKSVRNHALRMKHNNTPMALAGAKNFCRICKLPQRGHVCLGPPPAPTSSAAPTSPMSPAQA